MMKVVIILYNSSSCIVSHHWLHKRDSTTLTMVMMKTNQYKDGSKSNDPSKWPNNQTCGQELRGYWCSSSSIINICSHASNIWSRWQHNKDSHDANKLTQEQIKTEWLNNQTVIWRPGASLSMKRLINERKITVAYIWVWNPRQNSM